MQFIINISPNKASTIVPSVEEKLKALGFTRGISPQAKNCYDPYEEEVEHIGGFARDYKAIGMTAKEFLDHMKAYVKALDPTDPYLDFRSVGRV
jgi:hypothetical protein